MTEIKHHVIDPTIITPMGIELTKETLATSYITAIGSQTIKENAYTLERIETLKKEKENGTGDHLTLFRQQQELARYCSGPRSFSERIGPQHYSDEQCVALRMEIAILEQSIKAKEERQMITELNKVLSGERKL